LLRSADAFLRRQPDQHIARSAEILDLHIGEAERRHGSAHFLDVGGLGVADFHHGATRELHRQVQAARHQEEHCGSERQERDDVEYERVLHERDVAPDLEELHVLAFELTQPWL
jgi:hypothetical protein